MKRHPEWLAAGLLLAVVLGCNLSKNKNSNNSNNTNSNRSRSSSAPTPNRPADAAIYVDTVNMARDENGQAGTATTTFSPNERTVHCVINLNKAKGGTRIRVVWVAEDVEGTTNKELKALDYTTKAFEKQIRGHLTWSDSWPTGTYRLEIYVNGALDKTLNYTIQ